MGEKLYPAIDPEWRGRQSGRTEGIQIGAAVAFGLMGMAEAIRTNRWRYELTCAWCDCRVEVLEIPPFCDATCAEKASGRHGGADE